MNYYTVELCNVKYEHPYHGQSFPVAAESIIVKKGVFYATELLTGYKIPILPKKASDKFGVVHERYQNRQVADRTGYHLVIEERQFIPENLTTIRELDYYVNNYEHFKFKDIYESIKERAGEPKTHIPTVKQKAKRVSGTRK